MPAVPHLLLRHLLPIVNVELSHTCTSIYSLVFLDACFLLDVHVRLLLIIQPHYLSATAPQLCLY